ncbi:hypothetical protein HDU98_011583, partial [Podochytrium sp. JEL0797]
DAEVAESIQLEILEYFDPSNHAIVANKFSVLFEGCKSLVIDNMRGEVTASNDTQLQDVIREGRAREDALREKAHSLDEIRLMLEDSIQKLTDESIAMIERHDTLKTINQSLSTRLETSLSEDKLRKSEIESLKQDLELLKTGQERDADSSSLRLNQLHASLKSLIQTFSAELGLPSETMELCESVFDSAATFEPEYDWKSFPLVQAMHDMRDQQKSTIGDELKASFDREKQSLLDKMDAQTEVLEKLQRDLQMTETSIHFTQRDKERFQQNLEETQARADTLESELSEAKKISTAADRKSKKLQTSLKDLEAQHTQTLNAHSQLERDFQSLLQQLETYREDLDHAKNSQGAMMMDEAIFAKLQKEVQQKDERLAQFDAEYRKVHAAYQGEQSCVRELHGKLASMELEKSHACQESENIQERVNELEQEIEDMRLQEEALMSRLSIFESQSMDGGGGDVGGNTLLSEVDDRRIKSERKFAEMLNNQRKMHKEIQQLKKEKKELKNQLSLMDSASNGLSEEQLKEQLHAMSSIISGFKQRAAESSISAGPGDELDAETYDLVKLELHEKILENEVLRSENRSLRIISLNEMSKVRTAEYSLSRHDKKVQQAESAISILKDKLVAKSASFVSVDEDVEMECVDDEEEIENAKPVEEKEHKPRLDMTLPPPVQLQTQVHQAEARQPNIPTRREKAAQKFKQVSVKNEEAKDAASECNQQ